MKDRNPPPSGIIKKVIFLGNPAGILSENSYTKVYLSEKSFRKIIMIGVVLLDNS